MSTYSGVFTFNEIGMKQSVSIVTVTQWCRLPFLRILAKQITQQTSPSVIQWVIVDGSRDDDDQCRLQAVVCRPDFFSRPGVDVTYVSMLGDSNRTIGHLRNVSNRHATGDVIVAMDDDDYYPRDRITTTLKAMRKSPRIGLAGCCNHYIYEPDLDMIFQFTIFAPHHTVNTCMAYTRSYADAHAYDDSATFGEESVFTRHFRERMIPIPPRSSVVQMCHAFNTYSKRHLLLTNMCLPESKRNCQPTELTLADLIPDAALRHEFQALFPEKRTSRDDIVFYCGHSSIVWDPENRALGGSEHAVVELGRAFARRGHTVAVYGNFAEGTDKVVDGVHYMHWSQFRVKCAYTVLILWRLFGLMPMISLRQLDAKHIVIDLHDTSPDCYQLIRQHIDAIGTVAFKSAFHYTTFKAITKTELPDDKVFVCSNGIRVDTFRHCPDGMGRDNFRCMYGSCYTRGLYQILKYTWPLIKHLEPRASLDVYYGMDNVRDMKFRAEMTALLQQDGVKDHGRVCADVIAREKWHCGFYLYFTGTAAEIDTIAIREALLTGCIPIISSTGVFAERDGAHINLDTTDPQSYRKLAREVVALMNRQDLDDLRDYLRRSPTITSWDDTADAWLMRLGDALSEKAASEAVSFDEVKSPP